MTIRRLSLPAVLLSALLVLLSLPAAAQPDTASFEPATFEPATFEPAMPDPSPAPEGVESLPMHVLFIGNSHTYTNGGIDWHVGRLAASAVPPLPFIGESQTISAATLEEQWQLDSQGRIPDGGFDTVVIQGHIPHTNQRRARSFLKYARLFDAVVKENGARTVFFMTWPHPDYPKVRLRDIVRAHRTIARETGADVAPVAVAFARVQRERPELELIGPDGIHASWKGSYLAAAVIFATLFHRSPEGNSYRFGVSDEEAAYLQRVAWETVTSWNESL